MYGYLFIGIFKICLSKESPLAYLLYESNSSINRLITNSGLFFRDVRIDGIPFRVRQMMHQPKIIRSLFRDQAQGGDLEIREGWGKKWAGDSFGFNFLSILFCNISSLPIREDRFMRQTKSAFTSVRYFKTLRKAFYQKISC